MVEHQKEVSLADLSSIQHVHVNSKRTDLSLPQHNSGQQNQSRRKTAIAPVQHMIDFVENVMETKKEVTIVDEVIQSKILRDRSPEARLGRRKVLVRAVYGEFICSLFFYTTIFCTAAHGWNINASTEYKQITSAFVSGLMAIGLSFAFSSISGAQFNSAVSFALWLTGKLSNRRCFYYISVQLLASIVAMLVLTCIFNVGDTSDMYIAIAVYPSDDTDLAKVFATEFFFTFFLTYIAFTVAFEDAESQKKENMSVKTVSDSKGLTLYTSTPQSKTGFAPFSIGFMIFSLSLMGGTGGAAFNPGRLFGPAIFSGKISHLWLYWLGQITGSSTAALLVNNLHKFGLNGNTQLKSGEETSAVKELTSSNPAIALENSTEGLNEANASAVNDMGRESASNPLLI